MKHPDVVIYHGGCMDGFTAAWAFYMAFVERPIYIPGAYQNEPDYHLLKDKSIVMVDFSYKRPIIEKLAKVAKSITILDHHESAERELSDYSSFIVGDRGSYQSAIERASFNQSPVVVGFDMERSGAMLAWNFLFGEPAPLLINYVQDRDLWRFQLSGTRAVHAHLSSIEMNFDEWNKVYRDLMNGQTAAYIFNTGEGILRFIDRRVNELVLETSHNASFDGHVVPVANVPGFLASEAGNLLCKRFPDAPFVATWYTDCNGNEKWSLRSTGFNVAEIAERRGGGGHRRAAGFTIIKAGS